MNTLMPPPLWLVEHHNSTMRDMLKASDSLIERGPRILVEQHADRIDDKETGISIRFIREWKPEGWEARHEAALLFLTDARTSVAPTEHVSENHSTD